jgi:hypothetical protein
MSEKPLKTGTAKIIRGVFWLVLATVLLALLIFVMNQGGRPDSASTGMLGLVVLLLVSMGFTIMGKGFGERKLMLAAAANGGVEPPAPNRLHGPQSVSTTPNQPQGSPPIPATGTEPEALGKPSPVVVSDFSLRRHWRAIAWGATLQTHFTRFLAGGLVLGIGGAIADHAVDVVVAGVVTAPFAALFALALAFVGKIVSTILGDLAMVIVGLVSLPLWVFIICGDPLVWLLRQNFPRIVPVEKFSLINPKVILFVLDPTKLQTADA